MAKAWPFLTNQAVPSSANWREEIGTIENRELIRAENAEVSSSDDEEEGRRKLSFQNEVGKLGANHLNAEEPLRPDVKHERDFFLLGANAWLLVKIKFGFDVEIKRKCVMFSRENPLAVEIQSQGKESQAVRIPIPATGRFRYEDVLSGSHVKEQHKVAAAAAAAAAQAKHLGNVSDDDTADCGDDLVSTIEA
jgi:hypothetical protein